MIELSLGWAVAILIVLLIIVSVSVYYYISLSLNLKTLRNSENILCPTFFCTVYPKEDENSNKCISTGRAFRHNGNGIQCQNSTISNTSVWNEPKVSGLTKICQWDGSC